MLRVRRLLLLTLLLALGIPATGCATIATAPIIAAGAAAGQSGFAFWQSGTLKYVDEATVDQISTAVTRTNARLSLEVDGVLDEERDGVLRRTWRLRTATSRLLEVEVRPITETMCGVAVKVGLFGNRAAARLYVDRLRFELAGIRGDGSADRG